MHSIHLTLMLLWISETVPLVSKSGSQSTDLPKSSTPIHMAKCIFSKNNYIETYLNDSRNDSIPDPFLNKACHFCLRFISNAVVNIKSFDYRNKSRIEEVCKGRANNCLKYVTTCCKNAELCCEKQLKDLSNSTGRFCPRFWQGLVCIEPVAENETARLSCSKLNMNNLDDKFISVKCLANNTNKTNLFWENKDWSSCFSDYLSNEILILKTKSFLLFISLFLLLLSILVFITFKSLRSQLRIRVHINLFLSLSLRCAFDLVITFYLINDLYNASNKYMEKYVRRTSNNWIMNFLKYFQNTTFHWMFCEALLLYQLLFRTFEHISGIKIYLLIGWCIPLVFIVIYYNIRRFHPLYMTTERSPDEMIAKLEYLLRGPNILVLLLNIVFLINIVRLIRNLPPQPFDTSYWKRTLKAILILVPLFGLHLLLVIFSLPKNNKFYLIYSIIQNIVQDSQGVLVSLAFCALNQEHFYKLLDKWKSIGDRTGEYDVVGFNHSGRSIFQDLFGCMWARVIMQQNEVISLTKQKFSFFQSRFTKRVPINSSNNNRFNYRKMGSRNSRNLQRLSNSIPLCSGDSTPQQIDMFKKAHQTFIDSQSLNET